VCVCVCVCLCVAYMSERENWLLTPPSVAAMEGSGTPAENKKTLKKRIAPPPPVDTLGPKDFVNPIYLQSERK
jgi:hypothetical protein